MSPGPGVYIGVAALATAAAVGTLIQQRAATHIVAAGFWYDDVTYEVAALTPAGGPLTDAERAAVREASRRELRRAFAGLRLEVTDTPHAHYRVRVTQQFGERRPPRFGVAESRVFGALGGDGAVDFSVLATMAVDFAPAGTTRAELVEAIGRGIGRVAAHELAHQILPERNFHASTDAASYDFAGANRRTQFYGPIHWDLAGPWLRDALGRRPPAIATTPAIR